MSLFGKLFDKKQCAFCGGDIGLLGNKKLVDGNMCKNCASLLSPFMTDRRECTVAEIDDHLRYRAENKAQLEAFNPTRALGNRTKIYIDDNTGFFIVTNDPNWRRYNPDLISVDQVMACDLSIHDYRHEKYDRTPDGRHVSFDPPRYDYDFEFRMHLSINSPYFSEIHFELSDINRPDFPFGEEYEALERQAYEIQCTLMPNVAVEYPVNPFIGRPEFAPRRPAPVVHAGPAPRPAPAPRQAAPMPPRPAPVPPRPAPAPVPPRPAAPQPQMRPQQPVQPQARPAAPVQPQARPQQPAQPQARPQQPAQPQARPQQPANPQARPQQPTNPQARPQQPNPQARPQGNGPQRPNQGGGRR